MKAFLKNIIPIAIMGCLCQCSDEQQDCLTYKGEIHSYGCNGVVIKVTNRSVDSYMESG